MNVENLIAEVAFFLNVEEDIAMVAILGLIGLLILAAVIIARVIIGKRAKKKSKSRPAKEYKSTLPSSDGRIKSGFPGESISNDETYEVNESSDDGGQHTMYAYKISKSTKLCPNCDGENSPSASKCHICGSNLY